MEASASIVVAADASGVSRIVQLRDEAPLLLRRTGVASVPGPVEAHLVGGAAGPLGGDRLQLDIEVGTGAWLVLRSVAATVALPGPGGGQSLFAVRATVAAGGRLDWLPEPIVAAARCDHIAQSTADLAAGAYLTWREEVVCGRYGEECGNLRVATAVRLDGIPLYQQELAIGPRADGWAGSAVLGDARAAGSVLIVDPTWVYDGSPAPPAAGPNGALLHLAGPAALATAVAPDANQLRQALSAAIGPRT